MVFLLTALGGVNVVVPGHAPRDGKWCAFISWWVGGWVGVSFGFVNQKCNLSAYFQRSIMQPQAHEEDACLHAGCCCFYR